MVLKIEESIIMDRCANGFFSSSTTTTAIAYRDTQVTLRIKWDSPKQPSDSPVQPLSIGGRVATTFSSEELPRVIAYLKRVFQGKKITEITPALKEVSVPALLNIKVLANEVARAARRLHFLSDDEVALEAAKDEEGINPTERSIIYSLRHRATALKKDAQLGNPRAMAQMAKVRQVLTERLTTEYQEAKWIFDRVTELTQENEEVTFALSLVTDSWFGRS